MYNRNNKVIIIGSGIVALCSAILISKFSKIILLKAASRNHKRYIAITRTTQCLFQKIGIWKDLEDSVCPYNSMMIIDKLNNTNLEFNAHDFAEENVGYIVDQGIIIDILKEKISNNNNIVIHDNIDFQDVVINEKEVSIYLKDGDIINGDIVICASGKSSWLAKYLNITSYSKSYNQSALTGILTMERPHRFKAVQKFENNNIIAFLPMNDNANNVFLVWSGDYRDVNYIYKSDDQKDIVSKVSNDIFGNVLNMENMSIHELSHYHLDRYISKRCAFIGDSTNVFHPMAGQGMNIGLLGAIELSHLLLNKYLISGNLYSYDILRKYERNMKYAAWEMMTILHTIKWSFACNAYPIQLTRKIGLNMIGSSNIIKHKIVDFALGNIKRYSKILEGM